MFRRIAMVTIFFSFTLTFIHAGDPQDSKPASPSKMTLKVEMDRTTLLAASSQFATMRVSLEAPEVLEQVERPPVNVCLVLDVSGSMSGKKISAAKRGAIEAIKRLGAGDRVSIVTYSDTARVLLKGTNARDFRTLEKAINGLKAEGATALFAGVSLGASELRKAMDTHGIHRLVLLSDGQANRGPQTPEELGRLGVALSKEGISVSTLGLGNNYNEDLMTQLSQSSEGNTYYVETSSDLSRIFQSELGNVLNVYAQKVAVQLDFPANVKPIAVLGRSGRISEQKVVIPLKQINGGQEKFAMVKVEVLDGKTEEVREMVRAEAVYTRVNQKTSERLNTVASASFVKEEQVVAASVNKTVQRDAAIMENTASVDKALILTKQGRHLEAAAEMEKSIQNLEQTAEANDDDELRVVVKEMNSYAADIKSKKLDKKKRKKLRTKNYQTQSQQSAYVGVEAPMEPVVIPKKNNQKPKVKKVKPKKETVKKEKTESEKSDNKPSGNY